MTAQEYRPRTGTELIDAAFQLVKSQLPAIVTIVVVGCIPALVVQLFLPGRSPWGTTGRTPFIAGSIVGYIVSLLTALLIQGALLVALSEAYLGRTVVVGASLSAGLRNMGRLFVANFAAGVLAGLAFLLLIVPGFIVFAWFFVVPAIVVLERVPLTSAVLSRSRMLCGDRKLRILGFALVAWIIMVIGGMLVGLIALLAKSVLLAALLATIVQAIGWTIYTAFVIIQYYDARIRKEGFDVEMMAGTLPPPDQSDLAPA